MAKDDFIRNHDVFCYHCGYWVSLPNTRNIAEATKAAKLKGYKVVDGRLICALCKDSKDT